jgi:hypothetical protein
LRAAKREGNVSWNRRKERKKRWKKRRKDIQAAIVVENVYSPSHTIRRSILLEDRPRQTVMLDTSLLSLLKRQRLELLLDLSGERAWLACTSRGRCGSVAGNGRGGRTRSVGRGEEVGRGSCEGRLAVDKSGGEGVGRVGRVGERRRRGTVFGRGRKGKRTANRSGRDVALLRRWDVLQPGPRSSSAPQPAEESLEERSPSNGTRLHRQSPHNPGVVREDSREGAGDGESDGVVVMREDGGDDVVGEGGRGRGDGLQKKESVRTLSGCEGKGEKTHLGCPVHPANLDPADLREPPTSHMLRTLRNLLPPTRKRLKLHRKALLLKLEAPLRPHPYSDNDPDGSDTAKSGGEKVGIFLLRASNDGSTRKREDDVEEGNAGGEGAEGHTGAVSRGGNGTGEGLVGDRAEGGDGEVAAFEEDGVKVAEEDPAFCVESLRRLIDLYRGGNGRQ